MADTFNFADETYKLDRYLSGLDWHAGTIERHPPIEHALRAAFAAGRASAAPSPAPEAPRVPEADALREALRDAIEAIERAEPNRHSPWCNGVHEGGCCEGEYLMSGFMARLRAALSVGETPDDEKEGGR